MNHTPTPRTFASNPPVLAYSQEQIDDLLSIQAELVLHLEQILGEISVQGTIGRANWRIKKAAELLAKVRN